MLKDRLRDPFGENRNPKAEKEGVKTKYFCE